MTRAEIKRARSYRAFMSYSAIAQVMGRTVDEIAEACR